MKKSTLIILSITFFSVFANAQMTIMPYVQSDLSHFATFPDAETQVRAYNHRINTQPKFTHTFGIATNYILNENWEFKTGLEFQEMGDKSIEDYTGLFCSGPYYNKFVIENYHYFINVPIQIQYNLVNNKGLTPFIAFGTSVNINIQNDILYQKINNEELVMEEKVEIENGRKINFAFQLDTGFKRQLSKKLTLNIFLSGNMLLLPTIKNETYNARHFNIGLGIGVGYAI